MLAERLGERARERAMAVTGLPAHAVRVHAVAEFPRTASGKPDTAALVRHAAPLEAVRVEASVDEPVHAPNRSGRSSPSCWGGPTPVSRTRSPDSAATR